MNHINDINRRKRSYEVHALDQTSHAYHGNMVAPSAPYQWHEMDYTSQNMDAPRFAPTSAPVQYTTPDMMNFSPVDYARHDLTYATTYPEGDPSAAVQASTMYRVGPFRYTDLANMDGDSASVSQESIYSRSTRIHSLTDSERRDSHPHSVLSSNDMRRESEGFERIFPMTSIDSEPCQSELHRSDSTGLDLANLTSMEECTAAPRMAAPSHFAVPRRPSNQNPNNNDQESPIHATHSGFTSPTTLTFQDSMVTDSSKALKPRRMPRSKSAHASIGDGTAQEKASKLRARQAHSLVERKYRDNLNLKISQLHQTLQNTRYGPASATRSPSKEMKLDYFDEDTMISPDLPYEKSSTGSTPTGSKVRKSDVLTEAMNYVNSAEVEIKQMSEEMMRLNARVKTLEKLARCENCILLSQMVTLQVEGQQPAQQQ